MIVRTYTDLDGALKVRIRNGEKGAIIRINPSSLDTLPDLLEGGSYAEFTLDLSNACYIRRTKPDDIIDVGSPTAVTDRIGA